MGGKLNPTLALRVARILWGALFGSTCMFLFVLWFLQRSGSMPAEPADAMALPVLGVVALGMAAASVLLPRHLHRNSLRQAKLEVVAEVDERNGAALFRDAAPTIRVFTDPDAARRAAFARYHTPFIVGMALAESIALWGFSAAMLGAPLPQALPFWLVSWVLMVVRFPTPQRVYGPLEKVYEAVLR